MEYISFTTLYPKIAEKETRNLIINDSDILPDGTYALIPSFCADKKCDCRRALINVIFFSSDEDEGTHVATISYGWEARSFYKKWAEILDEKQLEIFVGPDLDNFQRQSKYSKDILTVVTDMLQRDKEYVTRLKRHYAYFKYKRKMKMPEDLLRFINTVGSCPCESGKMFRMCCGKVRKLGR